MKRGEIQINLDNKNTTNLFGSIFFVAQLLLFIIYYCCKVMYISYLIINLQFYNPKYVYIKKKYKQSSKKVIPYYI